MDIRSGTTDVVYVQNGNFQSRSMGLRFGLYAGECLLSFLGIAKSPTTHRFFYLVGVCLKIL